MPSDTRVTESAIPPRPLQAAVDGLLAIVFAPACAGCGQPLAAPLESAVCRGCWLSIPRQTPPFCSVCGDALLSWRSIEGAGARCVRCRRERASIAMGRSIGAYEGVLREIVHALKYEGRRSLAVQLAALMRRRGRSVLAGADCAVPVPLHWTRRWRRGFNQATDLAQGLGPPVVHALRRIRHTPSQTDLPATERHANVRRAFTAVRRAPVAGLTVVLVDDVSTTGATLEACARALLEAGAREVRTLTAARAVTRRPP